MNARRTHARAANRVGETRCGLPQKGRTIAHPTGTVTCPDCTAASEPAAYPPTTTLHTLPVDRPRTAVRTVVATCRGGEWHLDHPEATGISVHLEPIDVLRAVRKLDTKHAEKSGAMVITSLEWTDVPAGFIPPTFEDV